MICCFINLCGVFIIMLYKVIMVELVDEVMLVVCIVGVCNVVFKCDDGMLLGD